jgi:hypothetical protein
MSDWEQVVPILQGIISECNKLSDGCNFRSRLYGTINMVTQILTIGGTAIASATNSTSGFNVINIVILIIVAFINSVQTVFDWSKKVTVNDTAYLHLLELSTNINAQLATKVNLRQDAFQYLANIEKQKLTILRGLGYQNLDQQIVDNQKVLTNDTSRLLPVNNQKPSPEIVMGTLQPSSGNNFISEIKLNSVNVDTKNILSENSSVPLNPTPTPTPTPHEMDKEEKISIIIHRLKQK